MARRSEFKVIPPRPKAAIIAKRSKPQPQNRSVEHRVYGVGNLEYVRSLDDGSYVAVVTFNGVERTIRLAPEYWITKLSEIMALAPHLSPPPAPKVVKTESKARAAPDEVSEDGDPELSRESAETSEDGQDDTGPSEATWP
jgi:hypothetical protein